MAFTSDASNLIPGDTNNHRFDVFVRDLQTGVVTAVSTAASGGQVSSTSDGPSISADGRYVAFYSLAWDIATGEDTNGSYDVFVKDLQTGAITRVSTDANGDQGNSHSQDPSISADGRYVAFTSDASNLVAGDINGASDVFVRDLQTGTITRVSTDANGEQGSDASLSPSISADGRYVTFTSAASNLVPGDTNNVTDVFVRDLQTGAITRVSADVNGDQGTGGSFDPSISADGRYVAFASDASNLLPGDTNGATDVFVRDLQTGVITRVSTGLNGNQGTGRSYDPSISADGRYVAFVSAAFDLVPGDTNGTDDVFVRDLQTGAITRVLTAGDQGNSHSLNPTISADGRYVSFDSPASDLVPGDTNGTQDVFVVPNGLANAAPSIISNEGGDTAAVSVAENNTAVTTVMATDPDTGQSLSYSIAGGADAGLFTINCSTGALSFLELVNFENPTDAEGNNVYDVTVQVTDGNGGIDTQAIAVSVQNVIGVTIDGTAGNDLIDATHTTAGQPLPTNEEDVINGGKGRDTINGLGGNDTLNGGANADTMIGGMGDDTYIVDNTTDVVTENAGEGTDTVQSSVTCTLSGNVENLGLTGSGKANGTGNTLDNTITGNSGNNVLAGLAGADTLVGGAGNDTLVGGSGADILTGGSNADTFVFNATADSGLGMQDLITDFVHGTDFVDLRAIDASTSSKGNQAFVFGGHNSNVVAHGVTWFESGGNTFIQADVNGNATADLLIALTGTNHYLTATDFIL